MPQDILWLREISFKNVPEVGGKNASLGEMYKVLSKKGVNIPDGFALTTSAYWKFLKENGLEKKLSGLFKKYDPKSIKSLKKTGKKARRLVLRSRFPEDLEKEILKAYKKLNRKYGKDISVAVRSSGVVEDMPDASFAGQFETFLNVKGEKELLNAVKKCLASTFNDRVISYREEKKIDHLNFALSVGFLKMVRSDLASSGVIFTLDTETGFSDVVLINSIWGIGEMIVKGKITPDEFYVFKPTLKKKFKPIIVKNLGRKTKKYQYGRKNGLKEVPVKKSKQLQFSLTDKEIMTLARWAVLIEKHYSKKAGKWMPQDIEWAKDGETGELFVVQSRPETVHASKKEKVYREYIIEAKKKPLLKGIAVGDKIGKGKVKIIKDVSRIGKFKEGEVLVTKMTDPDWLPVMRMASAIVTDEGGKTCFSGETKVLTDKGILPIKDIIDRIEKERIKTLSLNKETLKLEWKEILNGFCRKSNLVEIEVSQTGRMRNNKLRVTPDHEFLTFNNRKLISQPIENIVSQKRMVISPSEVFQPEKVKLSPELGYLIGAIASDGHVRFDHRHGSAIFIQKPTEKKRPFIEKVKKSFTAVYNYNLHLHKKPKTEGVIRGKRIKGGEAIELVCYKKRIAEDLLNKINNSQKIILRADKNFVLNFLAGIIDGDGTYSSKANRINIFCEKKSLFNSIILACLRLGVSFQVSNNRTIYNIQIVDKVESLLKYTARVKGDYKRERFGTRFFGAKQLLGDIIGRVNYKGRTLPYIKNNLLIDAEKIKKHLIPMIEGESENHELTRIINSPLKMLRASLNKKEGRANVYNVEVKDNHNYIVFTERNTPLLVENCHAAIVSRELGVPAIIGTEKATSRLKIGEMVTVDCTQDRQGRIFEGEVPFKVKEYDLKRIPKLKTKIMMNIGAPEAAFKSASLPVEGIGLAREEFIIAEKIKVHPLALLNFGRLKSRKLKDKIEKITVEYKDKKEFFVKELAEGIAQIASAVYPKETIVRFSDFKTNEYRNLVGGYLYEDEEANPMMGFRGASRYVSKEFKPAFEMECEAIKRVREVFGLKNVNVMIPFCRTVKEGKDVLKVMKKKGLKRGKNLNIYVMCEIPSNVILADQFLKVFDGMSIGSNDLTQLSLGLDRDNGRIAYIGDETDPTVKKMISKTISLCKSKGKYCGICGDAPSSLPSFARFLMKEGIPSMSLSPDAVMKTILILSKKK